VRRRHATDGLARGRGKPRPYTILAPGDFTSCLRGTTHFVGFGSSSLRRLLSRLQFLCARAQLFRIAFDGSVTDVLGAGQGIGSN